MFVNILIKSLKITIRVLRFSPSVRKGIIRVYIKGYIHGLVKIKYGVHFYLQIKKETHFCVPFSY